MDEQELDKNEAQLALVKKVIEENGKDWEKWKWESRFDCFRAYFYSSQEYKEKILDLVRTNVDYGFTWYLAGID